MSALDLFGPATRAWFHTTFSSPTAAQEGGWKAIAAGNHTLVHAPTGSGKTLAAFLWTLDRLFAEPIPPEAERTRVLYISPMKALAYDIDRNLRAPLAGIRNAAGRLGSDVPDITASMRTGDTPADERRRLYRHPPDVLITTPESLYLMLTSRIRERLGTIRWVIVDEVHALAGNKRGAHLALSLERLEELTSEAPQRIGLSATQRPLELVARFLGGGQLIGDDWQPRPVEIVDAATEKVLEVEVVVPVEDMTRPEGTSSDDDLDPARRSIWPTTYERLHELIRAHRSVIVFANSRALAERIARQLNDLAGEEVAKAHHGSVSRAQRLEIEDRLKRGELRAVVATSTLELGIDMAAVDLVIMVETPPSVASALQRVGRAGHQVGAPSRAKLFPKHRGDLLEAAVVVSRMYEGAIETTAVPRNPLDVLAQQIVATVVVADREADDLFALARRAFPYAGLGRASFDAVLDMLAGRYPSDEFAELRARVSWDRVTGTLSARPGARLLAVTNPGTIPDRGTYRVVLPEGGRVGELDEEMVYESRPGDVFILGSSSWQIVEIDADRVVVIPAPAGASPQLPFWRGDGLGRPVELGRAIGELLAELGSMDQDAVAERLRRQHQMDQLAASNLAAYIDDERRATGTLPTADTLVIQRFRDEIGDWRLVLLSPYGARVHAPWALAVSHRLRVEHGIDTDGIWSDDGIILRFPDADEAPDSATLLIDPEDLERLVVEEVAESALFASRFREAAARALLLPRRGPDRRTPLWLQRRRSQDLLKVARKYGSFPIVLEAYREVLQDHFDLPATREILTGIRDRRIRVHDTRTERPSPFASSLLFDFIATYMYEYDAPLAERRATALTLDRQLLRELLGEPELRSLLDPEAMGSVELELQRLTPERRVRGGDGVHDLLRHLGPLTTDQVAARLAGGDAASLLTELQSAHRVFRAPDGRWAATEDAARLRDALGIPLPQGLPAALLEEVADPLGDVVGRYARTHGPFLTGDAAASLGLPAAVVDGVLGRLADAGRVTRGAFRPEGADHEWCDVEVLRRIRRRSLAALRQETEAAEPAALGRLLPLWQGVGGRASGPERLLEVVGIVQGAAVPASILEHDVLPARMAYGPDLLDQLTASGEVVWVGRGPLGSRDGRVSLYLREQVPLLYDGPDDDLPGEWRHAALRARLADRGASFFRDLYEAAGGGDPQDTLDALWDLVWAGEVTNDTMAPLRAFLWGKVRRRRGTGRPRLPTSVPPSATGRWYLVSDLTGAPSPPTSRAVAAAGQLLTRHGVVTRSAVTAEGVAGGFAALYPTLRAMEEAGKVRRGYYVEGQGGAQFALPGAIDRLRGTGAAGRVVLAAADPANPYGAALSWPDRGAPSRSAGAYVVLLDGRLAAFVERGARRVVTFDLDDEGLAAVAESLADVASTRLRRMELETIDGQPAAGTPLGARLAEEGFRTSYKGLAHHG